jgi:hypothetical protein
MSFPTEGQIWIVEITIGEDRHPSVLSGQVGEASGIRVFSTEAAADEHAARMGHVAGQTAVTQEQSVAWLHDWLASHKHVKGVYATGFVRDWYTTEEILAAK